MTSPHLKTRSEQAGAPRRIIDNLPMLIARNLAHRENSPRQFVAISRFFFGLAEFFERDRAAVMGRADVKFDGRHRFEPPLSAPSRDDERRRS
jgi:hypothetical protein